MNVSMIVAATPKMIIGNDNKLLWHIPEELAYFKQVTMGKAVFMGRKTFESIGKPLPGRDNYVFSRKELSIPGVNVLNELELPEIDDEVFIIGGGEVYKAFADKADKLYLTVVHLDCDGDTKLDLDLKDGWLLSKTDEHTSSNGIKYETQIWLRSYEHIH